MKDYKLKLRNLRASPTLVVYNESIKRELKIKPIYECRCDERLKTKAEESTRLASTGLHWVGRERVINFEKKKRLIKEGRKIKMANISFTLE